MATHTSLAARHLGATQSPSPMASTKPRLRGALRGLDLDNRLSQAVTETSIEDQDPTASIDNTPRHETRSTRNGRANVNYSQKYHPMDEVTRPKRAQRITGSRSLSASASHDGLDTSDEDEPELYSASESSDAIDQDDEAESPVERTPDPRAVRHSARAEAKKPVNYSKNHHPQDSAIPGFQHRAKRKRRSAQIDRPRKKKTKVQATADEPIVLSSERVIDSDSEGEVEGDRPPTIHSTPAKASTAEERQSSTASQDPDIGESDTPSSDDKRPPDMPRGESSFNEAENIIQGKHIARSQIFGKANDGLSDTGSAVAEDSERNLDDMNNKIIEATTIKTFLDNVGTSDGSQSDPASDQCDQPDERDVRPTRTTMPVALVTPVSMEASATPSQSYIQPKETSMIGTPRLGSQPMSSSSREAQKSSQLEFADEHLSPSVQPKLPTQHSSAGAEEGSTCEEKHQREVFCQALRGCSEQAARVPRAKQFTDGLSSEPSLLDRDTSEPRCEESNSASRQISRDTLPDDPSSNHFEEAIAVTGGGPQHDNDDDLPGQSNSEYSQMAVSDRERSDACAPDKRSSLKGVTSDAGNSEHSLLKSNDGD